MSLTESVDDVTSALVDVLKNQSDVAFQQVYYGDEDRIPFTPSASVSVMLDSELQGNTYRMIHTFTGVIVIYHAELQNEELARSECNKQAELIKGHVHTNTLGGIVVQSWVTKLEPGYSARSEKTVLKSTEITWLARSVTYG